MQRNETQVTPSVSPPVTLQVTEYGDRRSGPHVVMLHGFPDDQRMWEPVVAALPEHWHVVTFDLRGAGRSTRPAGRAAYRLDLLVEDLVTVIDATVPSSERVHLVGHDWGSTAAWEAVATSTWDPRLEDRLASFTSTSGPPLDHVASVGAGWRGTLRMLPQLLRSWYVGMFLLPWVPEQLWGPLQRLLRPLARRTEPTSDLLPWGREVRENARHSLNLYRANMVPRLRNPVPWRTSLPVQVVVATRDGLLLPRTFDGLEARCRNLTRVDVDTGHWLPRSRPEELAGLVRAFVEGRAGP